MPNKNWLIISLLLIFGLNQANATTLQSNKKHANTTRLVNYFLNKYHYKKVALDDHLSQKILQKYLKDLDPNRNYFTAIDVKQFEKYQFELDDKLKQHNLMPAFEIFNLYIKRLNARITFARHLLETPFDFSKDETYRYDRSEIEWAKNEQALDEIWRKKVKNDTLSLKLANKKPEKIKTTLEKRYKRLSTRINQLKSIDVYQLFTNAYTTSIEPHTSYFSPRETENFNINMRLSLEGIGAVLQIKNEYTMVRKTVPGGPAKKSKQIHSGDRIIGVGQADNEVVNVVGWRLEDVVDLIRGPKGTVVRLQILPKGASETDTGKMVRIVRNKIKLEEQAAKKEIKTLKTDWGALKIGVITLPTFYMDIAARAKGDANYKSTTRDVKRLINQLEKEKIAGLIIDLRNNGGGSLTEAIELTGLFIDIGPVVQVRDSDGGIKINRDTDEGMTYTGPLAVIVNRHSASASEIFAGAIQDYHRGLIVGGTTFGKGTVQTLIDLDRFSKDPDEQLGQLKVTIAQFFRVSGDSTQHRGIIPDIIFPLEIDAKESGESSLDNAITWAKIAKVRHDDFKTSMGTIDQLIKDHHRRIQKNPGFQYLIDELALVKENKDKTSVTLHLEKRKKEREDKKAKRKLRNIAYNEYRVSKGFKPLEEPDDSAEDEEDMVIEDDEDEKELDVVLDESVNILLDILSISPADPVLVLNRRSFAEKVSESLFGR